MKKAIIGFIAGVIVSAVTVFLGDTIFSSNKASNDAASIGKASLDDATLLQESSDDVECDNTPKVIEKIVKKTRVTNCSSIHSETKTSTNNSEQSRISETEVNHQSNGEKKSNSDRVIAFSDEVIDHAWAYDKEQEINRALIQVMTEHAGALESTVCRSDSCVIRVKNLSEQKVGQLIAQTMETVLGLDWVNLMGTTLPIRVNSKPDKNVFEMCVQRRTNVGCHNWHSLQ